MTQSSESSLSMLFYTLNHHSCSHLAYLIKIKLNHKPFFFFKLNISRKTVRSVRVGHNAALQIADEMERP